MPGKRWLFARAHPLSRRVSGARGPPSRGAQVQRERKFLAALGLAHHHLAGRVADGEEARQPPALGLERIDRKVS
jgi:hypothetical protein